MVSGPPASHVAPPDVPGVTSSAAPSVETGVTAASVAPSERAEAQAGLDGRQIFFLFVGSAAFACLIFVLGVTVGRRIEQRAAAQQKAPPADPLTVLDEIANAEEALTFHRAVLERTAQATPGNERPSRYTLFSATFAQKPAADDLLRRLREVGYKVKVTETVAPGQRPSYRLQIGDFGSQDGAQPIRSELLSRFGLATTVSRLPTATPSE